MAEQSEAHGEALPTEGTENDNDQGFVIDMTDDRVLVSITKHSSCTAENAWLSEEVGGDRVLLATAAFIGDVATFSPQPTLVDTQSYGVSVTTDLIENYTRRYKANTGNFPYNGTFLNWAHGFTSNDVDAWAESGHAYNIVSLITDSPATGTNAQINIGDAWKAIAGIQINIGDTWKVVEGMQINIGDTWKTIF